jgi:endonuclease YncB( thermonuclease family)
MIAGCEETDACGTHTDSSVSGRVVSVLKGDSIEVLHHQQAERIRLNGIDCSEKG